MILRKVTHIRNIFLNKYFLKSKIKFIYIKHKNIYRWIRIISSKIKYMKIIKKNPLLKKGEISKTKKIIEESDINWNIN
jgi:hypothetical protein